jgi:tetratricopeptide (TPR) repeat protein
VQNTYNKIILALLLLLLIFQAKEIYGYSGRRKHFLSHGPSVAAFGAGETVFSAYRDPSVLQYNPALMSFAANAVSVSRFNLFEGSSYNSAALAFRMCKNFYLGLSASNLASGNIEIRESIYALERLISINSWNYVFSFSGFVESLAVMYGLNVKCVYFDMYLKKGATYCCDFGLAKEVFLVNTIKIKTAFSVQNFISDKLKLDYTFTEIPLICRFSSAFVLPTYYRFTSKDTFNIYIDLKYEDSFGDVCTGLSYIFAEKYVLRTGYYSKHITFGAGADFYMFTVDYAADFSEIDLINRFMLTYRWWRNSDALLKEAKIALDEEISSMKIAQEEFKKAKELYNRKEYLKATDKLSKVIVSYPKFESPNHFYNDIITLMNNKAKDKNLNFADKYYAKAYIEYYNANYKEALNEWTKYIAFTGGKAEVFEYKDKIDNILKLKEMEDREKEITLKVQKLFQEGVELYSLKKWIQCIKKMESVDKLISNNNFSKSVEFYNKAKEYINKCVIELSNDELVVDSNDKESLREEVKYDEVTSDEKYREGLVLYAQGKYYQASRMWELALRLNPNHKKAKVALHRIKKIKFE